MKKSVTIISVAAAGAVAITGMVAGTRSNLASAFEPDDKVAAPAASPPGRPRRPPAAG